MTNVATNFSKDSKALRSALKHRDDATFFTATVKDAPVWQNGDRVAFVTGKFPAAKLDAYGVEYFVVLLDNGEVSAIQPWFVG